MNNDELKQQIKEIFPEEYREDIEMTWEKYIPSGKLGPTISIDSGIIYGFELDLLKALLGKEGYTINQLSTNNDGELEISFIPEGVL